MDTRALAKIDLNLLVALQVLLEERSVTRAATRLHITQPAMSRTLARLRDVFADELFTRTPSGMQPTPRAEALQSELGSVLYRLQHLVEPTRFDPSTWDGELTLAISEYLGASLLPLLMERIEKDAPKMTLRTITRVEHQLDKLASGDLDFVVHIAYSHLDEGIRTYQIGSSRSVLMCREGHPLIETSKNWEWDWDVVVRYPIIRLYVSDPEELKAFSDSSVMERWQGSMGAFETSHLLTALDVLRHTDYIMPGPPYILRESVATHGVTSIPIPEALAVEMDYVMMRHSRTDHSLPHQWFWQLVIEIVDSLRDS